LPCSFRPCHTGLAAQALRCSPDHLVTLVAGVAAPALTAPLRCDPHRLRRLAPTSVTVRPSKAEIALPDYDLSNQKGFGPFCRMRMPSTAHDQSAPCNKLQVHRVRRRRIVPVNRDVALMRGQWPRLRARAFELRQGASVGARIL
jgi:hypothetical protein